MTLRITCSSVIFVIGLVAMPLAAGAQLYEDSLEPADLQLTDLDSLVMPAGAYAGNTRCVACHAPAHDLWLGTRHARSYVRLQTDIAREIAKREGIIGDDPLKSARCLNCHGTAHNVAAAYRGPDVRMAEGVTCEKCHGPAEVHAEAFSAFPARLFSTVSMIYHRIARKMSASHVESADLVMPNEAGCRTCHDPRESHDILKKAPFDYAGALKKILHPSSGS